MHLNAVTLHPERYPAADCYPFNLPVFRATGRLDFTTPVTLFAGENGTGKSTLLESIAARCDIHIWRAREARTEVNPFEDELYKYMEVAWRQGPVPGSFFGSDIFKHFARLLETWAVDDPGLFEYFGGRSLLTQSHGQSLMSFFRSRYKIKGLYLLDEPETALSPKSQLELLKLLAETSAAGHAQFLIASHSPLLLACPGAVIYSFREEGVRRVEYEETEHYRIYRGFLEDRWRYLGGL